LTGVLATSEQFLHSGREVPPGLQVLYLHIVLGRVGVLRILVPEEVPYPVQGVVVEAMHLEGVVGDADPSPMLHHVVPGIRPLLEVLDCLRIGVEGVQQRDLLVYSEAVPWDSLGHLVREVCRSVLRLHLGQLLISLGVQLLDVRQYLVETVQDLPVAPDPSLGLVLVHADCGPEG